MPFLGPIIAAWVVLAIVVLATYFLFVAGNVERGGEQQEVVWRPSIRNTPPNPRERAAISRHLQVTHYDMANPAKAWDRRPASGG